MFCCRAKLKKLNFLKVDCVVRNWNKMDFLSSSKVMKGMLRLSRRNAMVFYVDVWNITCWKWDNWNVTSKSLFPINLFFLPLYVGFAIWSYIWKIYQYGTFHRTLVQKINQDEEKGICSIKSNCVTKVLEYLAGYLPETFLATHKTRKMSSKRTRIPILNSVDGFEEKKDKNVNRKKIISAFQSKNKSFDLAFTVFKCQFHWNWKFRNYFVDRNL